MAKQTTQQTLADLTGLSQQRISQLQRSGVIVRGENPVTSVRKIISRLGAEAAGRQSSKSGKYDLVDERARLAAHQANKVEIETARMRAELLPVKFITEIMSSSYSVIRSRVLSQPNALKAKFPNKIDTEVFLYAKQLANEVLEELSRVRYPAELDERIKQYFSDIQTATASNGDRMGG